MSGSGCDRFDQATLREDPSAFAELEVHARVCVSCGERLTLWRTIGEAAPSLQKAWASPDLAGRIGRAIAAQSPSAGGAPPALAPRAPSRLGWLPVAAMVALTVLSMIGLQVFREGAGREPLANPSLGREALMTERALADVESAEAVYLGSIEKLSSLARERLEDPASPTAASYREKLMLLDSAIAEIRAEADRNRFNTHLRKELLGMYREKQRTLQDLMKESSS
jgi:hypothetical protein